MTAQIDAFSAKHGQTSLWQGFRKMAAGRIGIRWIILSCFLLISIVPILSLYKYIEDSAVRREIANVEQSHLIIAQNLSVAMERYATDVELIFEITADALDAGKTSLFDTGLTDFDMEFVVLLDGNNTPVAQASAGDTNTFGLLAPKMLSDLRAFAEQDNGSVVFSGILPFNEKPHIFVLKAFDDGMLALAPLSPRYLNKLQKSVAFGEKGHSMMVDQFGHVIAHPNAEWQASSKDASKISAVRRMMAGETGVQQFYSPPLKADMIAGFTFVPRTGWGVMVPQPVSELVNRAKEKQSTVLAFVGLIIFVAVAASWFLANLVSAPIRDVVDTANRVSAGDLDARVDLSNSVICPKEAALMGGAFNKVVADLQREQLHLTAALVAAEAGSRAKSNFISVMSHEIRTPMHGVMGVMELLDSSALNDKQRSLLAVGQKAGRNMVHLLDEVLTLARLESGAAAVNVQPFSVSALVSEIIDLFGPAATLKSVDLNSSLSLAGSDMLNGDAPKLKQILMNLVGNAVKFTETGEIRVEAAVVKGDGDTPVLSLQVIDSGIGIAPEERAKIFNDFHQVESEYNRSFGGSGLGLSIASRIVRLLGGEVAVSDGMRGGSCFEVKVPLQRASI
jgi:signal transduction histidine kinase